MIHEAAGELGLDPAPFTLREIAWMLEGRRRSNWDLLGEILAMLHNINRDPKKTQAISAIEINPYRKKSQAVTKVSPREFVEALALMVGAQPSN